MRARRQGTGRPGWSATIVVLAAALGAALPAGAQAPEEVVIDQAFFESGQWQAAERALQARLAADPADADSRLKLGVIRVLLAVERLGRQMHERGLRASNVELGWRLPLPEHPDPRTMDLATLRGILENFAADLRSAESVLAGLNAEPVKLTLHPGRVRFDLDGDRRRSEAESLSALVGRASIRPGDANAAALDEVVVTLDAADAHWLRGYCHLLMGLCEFALAHDASELFDSSAHLFFKKVETPHAFLRQDRAPDMGFSERVIEAVTLVHLIDLEPAEPARLRAALGHFEAVIRAGRASWDLILAETDDENEWVPGPQQQNSATGVMVTQAEVDRWLAVLDQAEAVLAGQKLIPFWRPGETRGLNLRRVFVDPHRFDLIRWVHGSAATPYLEAGELTPGNFWREAVGGFGGSFFTRAVWFN